MCNFYIILCIFLAFMTKNKISFKTRVVEIGVSLGHIAAVSQLGGAGLWRKGRSPNSLTHHKKQGIHRTRGQGHQLSVLITNDMA